jgi:hypothetical protein
MQSFYRHGSNGRVNLFFRQEGFRYKVACEQQLYPAIAEKSYWIVQWEGSPEFDSGYASYEFATRLSAEKLFDEMMEGEENARR